MRHAQTLEHAETVKAVISYILRPDSLSLTSPEVKDKDIQDQYLTFVATKTPTTKAVKLITFFYFLVSENLSQKYGLPVKVKLSGSSKIELSPPPFIPPSSLPYKGKEAIVGRKKEIIATSELLPFLEIQKMNGSTQKDYHNLLFEVETENIEAVIYLLNELNFSNKHLADVIDKVKQESSKAVLDLLNMRLNQIKEAEQKVKALEVEGKKLEEKEERGEERKLPSGVDEGKVASVIRRKNNATLVQLDEIRKMLNLSWGQMASKAQELAKSDPNALIDIVGYILETNDSEKIKTMIESFKKASPTLKDVKMIALYFYLDSLGVFRRLTGLAPSSRVSVDVPSKPSPPTLPLSFPPTAPPKSYLPVSSEEFKEGDIIREESLGRTTSSAVNIIQDIEDEKKKHKEDDRNNPPVPIQVGEISKILKNILRLSGDIGEVRTEDGEIGKMLREITPEHKEVLRCLSLIP